MDVIPKSKDQLEKFMTIHVIAKVDHVHTCALAERKCAFRDIFTVIIVYSCSTDVLVLSVSEL